MKNCSKNTGETLFKREIKIKIKLFKNEKLKKIQDRSKGFREIFTRKNFFADAKGKLEAEVKGKLVFEWRFELRK